MLKGIILAEIMLACLAFNAPAEIHVTRFDPPLNISAFPVQGVISPAGVPQIGVLPIDFNLDDNVDFRLAYGLGGIEAYFNAPTRFAFRTLPPPSPGQPYSNIVLQSGPVAAIPFGSVIGSNIVSFVRTSYFGWSEGYTNQFDLTQSLGDHDATVISLNTIAASARSQTVQPILPGPLPGPPFIGDVVGKEGAMAVEFYINGQPHYGYIQFDFRSNSASLIVPGGLIYGWAYETEPGVPIIAAPIGGERAHSRDGRQTHRPRSSFRR